MSLCRTLSRTQADSLSLGAALRAGARCLQTVSDAARLEAEVLLSDVTGFSRATLLAHPEWELSPARWAAYARYLSNRAAGFPLPYLTGRVEFYGLEMTVSPDVLIPRPETETLVDLALERRPERVVEVGTGSGCIAVALATRLHDTRVWASDISARALRVAAVNARRHGVRERVHLVRCDLCTSFSGPVDLLVSNPPYVADDEWASLPLSVRRHEPRLALDGGVDGLDFVRRLLASVPRILRPGGGLLIEIGASQGSAARALARATLPGARIAIHPDLAGRDRVLEIVTSSN